MLTIRLPFSNCILRKCYCQNVSYATFRLLFSSHLEEVRGTEVKMSVVFILNIQKCKQNDILSKMLVEENNFCTLYYSPTSPLSDFVKNYQTL